MPGNLKNKFLSQVLRKKLEGNYIFSWFRYSVNFTLFQALNSLITALCADLATAAIVINENNNILHYLINV